MRLRLARKIWKANQTARRHAYTTGQIRRAFRRYSRTLEYWRGLIRQARVIVAEREE